jgi:hypothetical protein
MRLLVTISHKLFVASNHGGSIANSNGGRMSKRVLLSLVSVVAVGLVACSESATAPTDLATRQNAHADASTVCKTGYTAAVDPSNAAEVTADVNQNGTICVTMDLSFNTKRPARTPMYRYADDLL